MVCSPSGIEMVSSQQHGMGKLDFPRHKTRYISP